MSSKKNVLFRKVTAIIFIAITFFGFLFAYLAHKTGYEMLEKQVQARADGIANVSINMLSHLMMEGKHTKLQLVLHTAWDRSKTANVFILKPDGTVVMSSKVELIGTKFDLKFISGSDSSMSRKNISVKEQNIHYNYLTAPVQNEPQCKTCHQDAGKILGYIVVKVSMEDMVKIALEHRKMNIMLTIFMITGLGITIFGVIFFIVIKPINKFKNHIQAIQTNVNNFENETSFQFAIVPKPKNKDEISNLVTAYNQLIIRLNEARSKIHNMHQKQLEQADRLFTVGEMAASLAHEIKNPVAGVIGALQIFETNPSDMKNNKEIIKEMISLMERINQAINDLLTYAKPTPPVFDRVELMNLINRVPPLLSSIINNKEISFEISNLGNDVNICADKNQLIQVFFNLLQNSIQAIDQKGKISIKVDVENENVRIDITDNGKGISDESLKNLFKPFFTTKHKGTGLGLAISKRIIEHHNGRIYFVSKVGFGTTVTIIIPKEQKK